MSYIRAKLINGRSYLYLVESRREGGRVIQKHIKYLGRGTKADIQDKYQELGITPSREVKYEQDHNLSDPELQGKVGTTGFTPDTKKELDYWKKSENYNAITTSDLQGVLQAVAIAELKAQGKEPTPLEVGKLQDKLLKEVEQGQAKEGAFSPALLKQRKHGYEEFSTEHLESVLEFQMEHGEKDKELNITALKQVLAERKIDGGASMGGPTEGKIEREKIAMAGVLGKEEWEQKYAGEYAFFKRKAKDMPSGDVEVLYSMKERSFMKDGGKWYYSDDTTSETEMEDWKRITLTATIHKLDQGIDPANDKKFSKESKVTRWTEEQIEESLKKPFKMDHSKKVGTTKSSPLNIVTMVDDGKSDRVGEISTEFQKRYQAIKKSNPKGYQDEFDQKRDIIALEIAQKMGGNMRINSKDGSYIYDFSSNKNFRKEGATTGSGWGKTEKGATVTSVKNIKKGDTLLTHSNQFNAKNVLVVTGVDKDRGLIEGHYVDPNDPSKKRMAGDKTITVWDFQLKDKEYSKPGKASKKKVGTTKIDKKKRLAKFKKDYKLNSTQELKEMSKPGYFDYKSPNESPELHTKAVKEVLAERKKKEASKKKASKPQTEGKKGSLREIPKAKGQEKEYNMAFREVEHPGDLREVYQDITNSGGKIIGGHVVEKDEVGVVGFYMDKKAYDKFKKTDSYEMRT